MAFLILAFDKIEIYKQYHLQQKKKRKKKNYGTFKVHVISITEFKNSFSK